MALIRRKMSNHDYFQIKLFLETDENENFDYDLSSAATADYLEEVQLYCISVPKDKKERVMQFLNSKKSDRGVAKILAQLSSASNKRQQAYVQAQAQAQTQSQSQTQIQTPQQQQQQQQQPQPLQANDYDDEDDYADL